jgi:hypothetical protein
MSAACPPTSGPETGPDFAIASPNWDTFVRWEWRSDRPAGYLGDADWDRNWVPAASSSSSSDDDDEDTDNEEDDFREHDG